MLGKSVNYYLIKVVRISGWLLLGLMVVYIATGFALCDKWSMSRLIDVQTALVIHQVFDWPLLVIFLVHSSANSFLALRRWGWIPSNRSR